MYKPIDEEWRQRRIAATKEACAPVLRDLARSGYDVRSIADLLRLGVPYASAVTILLDWLERTPNIDAKNVIVRVLGVPWAKPIAGPVLVRTFLAAEGDESHEYKWAIGNALEILAEERLADDLLRVSADRGHGTARQMVVMGLGKLRKDPRVPDALIGLLEDGEVAGHAVIALGKLRAERARPHLERMLDHPRAWVRREVKRALRTLDARAEKNPSPADPTVFRTSPASEGPGRDMRATRGSIATDGYDADSRGDPCQAPSCRFH